MSEENFSPADVMAMMNNGNNNWNNNPFIWLVFMAMFGNGNWFNNRGYNDAAMQGAITRGELTDGLNSQNLQNDIRAVAQRINDVGSLVQGTSANINQTTQAVGNDITQTIQGVGAGLAKDMCCGFKDANTNLFSATAGLAKDINFGFNATNMNDIRNTNDIINAITTSSSAQQLANCGISHSIQDLKYEMGQNCCDLKTAMHSEGEATRALIQNNTIQDLRDKLADKASDLQAAQLTLANASQTQNILSSLGRYVPACGCNGNNW